MNTFLTSDEWRYRLGRTVVQGVIGVVIANLDLIVGACILDATWRPFVVAMVMAFCRLLWQFWAELISMAVTVSLVVLV